MSEPTQQEIADVLSRAHDVIVRYGWCQESLEDVQGRHCVLGAIADASGIRVAGSLLYPSEWGDPVGRAAVETLAEVIDSTGPTMFATVNYTTRWNDAEERTEDDVLDALRLAEKKLAEQ